MSMVDKNTYGVSWKKEEEFFDENQLLIEDGSFFEM